jgi:hypothetical protein
MPFGEKRSSLFSQSISNDENKFYNIEPVRNELEEQKPVFQVEQELLPPRHCSRIGRKRICKLMRFVIKTILVAAKQNDLA